MKTILISTKLIFLAVLLLLTSNTNAKTIFYVTQNGTGTGTSWAAASGNIQAMIDKAISGDEVWVAKGTYYPTTETIARDARSRTFLLKSGVIMYGGFVGSETAITQRSLTDLDANGKVDPFELLNATLLSGNIDGVADVWTKKFNPDGITWKWTVTGNEANCYRVVSGFHATMDGFSVEGGNANDAQYNFGGGIYTLFSSSVTNCTVTNCSARFGGGISSSSSSSPPSTSSVTNCKVSNCSALSNGGGIYSPSSSYVINCMVSNCSAGSSGGGISSNDSSPVTNCTVSNCSADLYGGGIYSAYFASFVSNCIVINCSAGSSGGGIYSFTSVTYCTVNNCSAGSSGGGIYSSTSTTNTNTPDVKTCTVNNCSAGSSGGGIYSSYSFVKNCTVTNCSADLYGGGIYSSTSTITTTSDITNCMVSNCSGGSSGGGIFSSYSSVKNCSASNNKIGNTNSNIMCTKQSDNIEPDVNVAYLKPTSFVGVATSDAQKNELLIADWQLREGSPCINSGLLTNLFDGDIDNNPRIKYGVIDIGAYEFKISSISLPVVENFDLWTDFNRSPILPKLYGSAKLNTRNDIKWTVENMKAVFSWKTNLIGKYSQQFFTYEINATNALKVILRYDMYFEAYSGTISPLGTEKLSVEYSTNLVTWFTIANYSNQNGTIPNKTYLHDISALLAGKKFFIRFNAIGENTNRIEKWELDNIIVDTDGKTTDIKQIKEPPFLYSINNGILNIQNLKEATKVQLFDLNGKLLNYYKPVSNSIQFTIPVHGVYIIRTESALGIESKKVVW
jgi:hypothetical protein